MQRPESGEYKSYFEQYIGLTPKSDFAESYILNTREVEDFFLELPDSKHDFGYAEGKWTLRQVLQHIIDMERVMAYRAFIIVRNRGAVAQTPVDENIFAENADVSMRTFDSLVRELMAVRQANKYFFESLSDEESKLQGEVSGHPTTPRALGYIIMGHALHHIMVVKERYM